MPAPLFLPSPDDVDTFLTITDQRCAAVAEYQFANVMKLMQDFQGSKFAPAFATGEKTYTGYRLGDDPGGLVCVHIENGPIYELALRHDLRKHADGFEWQYSGGGPAQLALALASDVLHNDDRAGEIYQKLKFRLIAKLPRDGWSLPESELHQHIDEIEQERGGLDRF